MHTAVLGVLTGICGFPLRAERAEADIAWAQLSALMDKDSENMSAEGRYLDQIATAEAIRRDGTLFWNRYPTDPRRFRWLLATVAAHPNDFDGPPDGASVLRGFSQATGNLKAQTDCEFAYARFRAEYFTSPETSSVKWMRPALKAAELRRSVSRLRRYVASIGDAAISGQQAELYANVRDQLVYQIWDLSVQSDYNAAVGIADLLRNALGSDISGLQLLLETLSSSPNEEARKYAAGQKRVERMRKEPLHLHLNTFSGEKLDLGKYHGCGRVVWLWSNYCSASINGLRAMEQLRSKYSEAGLTVTAIWANHPEINNYYSSVEEKERARNYLSKHNTSFECAVVEREHYDEFRNEFGIIGYPVLWLFDEKGLLIYQGNYGPDVLAKIDTLITLGAAQRVNEH